MIEIHAHVIYGVDDGPQTRDEMEKMLYSAAASGVKRLYCTSHYKAGHEWQERYQQHLAEARAWCKDNTPQLELFSGAELFYSEQLLREEKIPTYDKINYILLEFASDCSCIMRMDAVKKVRSAGYQVILAHIERNWGLWSTRQLKRLREEYGVRTQVNAQTVIGWPDGLLFRRRIRRWIEEGLVDFVASDAHNLQNRPFCLQYARMALAQRYGEELAERLCGGSFSELTRQEQKC